MFIPLITLALIVVLTALFYKPVQHLVQMLTQRRVKRLYDTAVLKLSNRYRYSGVLTDDDIDEIESWLNNELNDIFE